MKRRGYGISLMVLVGLCVSLLTGCGGPSAKEQIKQDLTEELAQVKDIDEDVLEQFDKNAGEDLGEFGVSSSDFAQAYFDGFDYTIGEVKLAEDEKTAKVDVKIKMKNLGDIVKNFEGSYSEKMNEIDPSTIRSSGELLVLAGEVLLDEAQAAEPVESDCTFDYRLDEDGEWEMADSSMRQLIGAMS